MYEHPDFFNNSEAIQFGVVYTKNKHEKTLVEAFLSYQIPCYLPLYRKRLRYKRKGEEMTTIPLFQGYFFIQLLEEKYIETKQLLEKCISYFEVEAAAKEQFLEELMQIKTILDSKDIVEPYEHISEGDKVKVTDGPLKEMEGIVLQDKKQFRFVVSLEILGKFISCEIDPIKLKKLT